MTASRLITSTGTEIVYIPARDGLERFLGQSEARLMLYLWEEGQPRTIVQVMKHFGDERAYSTYTTTLNRMVEKGLLRREPDPHSQTNGYLYSPTLDSEEFYRKAVLTILDALSDDCPDILEEVLASKYREMYREATYRD